MGKIDQYRRGIEFCATNAARARVDEVRALWMTIKRSSEYLLSLELRDGIWPSAHGPDPFDPARFTPIRLFASRSRP